MLRISKLTDYGVVLATQLASTAEPSSVRDLAAQTGIPQPTVSKVLKRLARADVVVSQRGARGGYQLARPAPEIPIAAVIEALEGPIAVTECTSDGVDPSCEYEGSCDTQANWQRINAAIQQALEGISVADMARPQLVTLSRSRVEAARSRAPGGTA